MSRSFQFKLFNPVDKVVLCWSFELVVALNTRINLVSATDFHYFSYFVLFNANLHHNLTIPWMQHNENKEKNPTFFQKIIRLFHCMSLCTATHLIYTNLGCNNLRSWAQRGLSPGIPSGQKESCVLRTFLTVFASLAFDPSQPSLVKEHNPPNKDLNKQCNPQPSADTHHLSQVLDFAAVVASLIWAVDLFKIILSSADSGNSMSWKLVHSCAPCNINSVLFCSVCVSTAVFVAPAPLPSPASPQHRAPLLPPSHLKKVHQYFARPLTWPAQLNNGIFWVH